MTKRQKKNRGSALAARAAALGAAIFACAGAARADVWTNGSGDGIWQTNGNWQDSSAPSLGDDVLFGTPGPASHTVTVASGGTAANARTLQFDGDYTIGGSGAINVPAAAITTTGVATATINAKIASRGPELRVHNPVTGEVVGSVARDTPRDVEELLASLKSCERPLTPQRRSEILLNAAIWLVLAVIPHGFSMLVWLSDVAVSASTR